MLESIKTIAFESFVLLAQMSPYLLLGVAAAGALHVLLPIGTVSKHLGPSTPGSVIRAAILGIPLPICSCGVVPVAASLKKEGASNGATVSFLVTTPTTGVDSVLATYSLLGLPLTIARVLAALVLGIVAGMASNLGFVSRDTKEVDSPDTCDVPVNSQAKQNRLLKALNYSLNDLLAGISRPLAIGIVLGGLVAFLMPKDFIGQYIGDGFTPYLVMMAIGIPLYVCASGSIPIAAALLAKGISPGAALVFLIAGPATNIATVTIISSMLGKRTAAVYLMVLVLGSLGAGVAADAVFASFPTLAASMGAAGHAHETGLTWLEISGGISMGLLIAYFGMLGIKTRLSRLSGSDTGALVYEVKGMS